MNPKEKAIKYLEGYRKRTLNKSNMKTKEFNPQLTTIHYFPIYVEAINLALREQAKEILEEFKRLSTGYGIKEDIRCYEITIGNLAHIEKKFTK